MVVMSNSNEDFVDALQSRTPPVVYRLPTVHTRRSASLIDLIAFVYLQDKAFLPRQQYVSKRELRKVIDEFPVLNPSLNGRGRYSTTPFPTTPALIRLDNRETQHRRSLSVARCRVEV